MSLPFLLPLCVPWGLYAAFYGRRTGQGMAAKGRLADTGPLSPCGRAAAEGRRAGSHWRDTQAAGEGGGRNIALLDKRQCCDETGRNHRNGGK